MEGSPFTPRISTDPQWGSYPMVASFRSHDLPPSLMIPMAKCYPCCDGSWKGNVEGMFLRKEVRMFTPAIFSAWGVGGESLNKRSTSRERRGGGMWGWVFLDFLKLWDVGSTEGDRLGRRWGNGLASLAGTGQGGVSVLPCIRQWWTRCASATGANCAHTWLCHFAGPVPSCPCSWAFCPWLAAWTTELGLPASCQGAPGHSLGLGCKPGQCCLPSCRSWSSDCLRQLKSLSSDGVLCKKPGALVHPISKSEFLNTTAVEGGLK